MKRTTLALVGLLALMVVAQPAEAKLVIKGRSAQALQCAAIQFSVSQVLFAGGMIGAKERNEGQLKAVRYLHHVPGTERQKMKAMEMKLDQIFQNKSLLDLVGDWDKSRKWCARNFSQRKS